jgi:arginyl-tRNA synthetase
LVKKDGGFNYDSTDMAAINYRFNTLKADRCIYITDKGQEFHFKQIFEAAYHAKIIDKAHHRVDHMGFGLVLDKNNEKIKSRSGETIKLRELLDEARKRACELSMQKL